MTDSRPSRSPLLLAVIALALVLAASGGAVAGSMVTSKQIKNGTIRTVDLAPQTRQQLQVVGGYRQVRVFEDFADGDTRSGSLPVTCPRGTALISATADYIFRVTDSSVVLTYLPAGARADFIYLDTGANRISLQAVCGRASKR